MAEICKHEHRVQEYETVTSQYEDRECFEFYDGPILGTASCRSCGQVFLFEEEDKDSSGRVSLYFPIDPERELLFKEGQLDPRVVADELRSQPHLRVHEVFRGPCRVTWMYPG